MPCNGSSEKDISVAFEKLSIISSDQTSNQTKNISGNPPPLESQILSALQKIRKSKNRADVKAITKKIDKTSGTRFDEGCFAVNLSQLLDKKIITNIKTPQHLNSFRLSTTEITSEDNLPLQVEEIILDTTEKCQHNTHSNAVEKSSDETKITTCHTNEMSAIVQQLTWDNTLITVPNDVHTPITENHRTSLSASSTDESFQKLELKVYELNKSVNSELGLLNKKNGFSF